jgi:hypothetical protein
MKGRAMLRQTCRLSAAAALLPERSMNQAPDWRSHKFSLTIEKGGFMPWKLASLGALLAVATLAGCSTAATDSATDPVTTTDTGHSRCEAKAAEFTLGKTASAELLEQARKRAGAQNARFLSPNDMVTLEYRSDRLNLSTDANKVVTRVNCG